MRDYKQYAYLVCDIDNTLIHGWFVDFMHWSWNKLHCELFGKFCMMIQYYFKLYTPNKFLVEILKQHGHYAFLTARGTSDYTDRMVKDIMGKQCWIFSLGCDNSVEAKSEKIKKLYREAVSNVCLFEDDDATRRECLKICDAFTAEYMFKPLVY